MNSQFIPYNRPNISEEECREVVDTLKSLWLTTGPKTKKFEERFCETSGARAALALNSCTAGLHLGLKALGVKPGDEVITTPLTFCATANVIEHLGARTVLADIDPETWLISPSEIEKKISDKTKVILPVHFAGNMCDMESINALAKKHGVAVLEDCAHCLPNSYENGVYVGGTDNLCAFSFYANKNITTGEGGMLTGPEYLIDLCRAWSLHGMSRDAWKRFEKSGNWRYDVQEPGFKYNMTDMQASLGLVQLAKIDQFYSARKQLALEYTKCLSSIDCLELPQCRSNSSYHIYPILISPERTSLNRDQFIETMKNHEIGVSVHYIPLHFFSYYSQKYGWEKRDFPNASYVGENCVTLPLYPKLSQEEQMRVIEVIKSIFGDL